MTDQNVWRPQKIGYWTATPGGSADSTWLHPSVLVDEQWEAEFRNQIVDYLQTCPLAWHSAGLSPCRFGCGDPNGSCEITDGEWVWPEGLGHYVEVHHVRLPDEFIGTMKRHRFKPPQLDFNPGRHLEDMDASWLEFWNEWCRQQRANARE